MTTIFIIEHATAGDICRSYGGMSQETVEALVSENGNPYDFVDEATYNAKLAESAARLEALRANK
jgi:hypothetical protein